MTVSPRWFFTTCRQRTMPALRDLVRRLSKHFDLDAYRVTHLDRPEQPHALEADERQTGAVQHAGLGGQSLGHGEGEAARGDALAVVRLVPHVLRIHEQGFDEAGQVHELDHVGLRDRTPKCLVDVARPILFVGQSVLHA